MVALLVEPVVTAFFGALGGAVLAAVAGAVLAAAGAAKSGVSASGTVTGLVIAAGRLRRRRGRHQRGAHLACGEPPPGQVPQRKLTSAPRKQENR